MRVNIYAEEMTDKVEIVSKGEFTGLRFYLELPATVNDKQYQGPFIHRPGDDDSSAVTFWGKRKLRDILVKALEALDSHYAKEKMTKFVWSSMYDPKSAINVLYHCDGYNTEAEAIASAQAANVPEEHWGILYKVEVTFRLDFREGGK